MPISFPSPDPSAQELVEFVVLPNLGGGFGHGVTDRGFKTRSGYLLPEGYNRTINMTVSDDGTTLSPSMAYTGTGFAVTIAQKTALVAWTDNGTPAQPIVVALNGQASQTVVGGGSSSTDTSVLTGYYWDACLHDAGGTANLYATTVSSLTTEAASRLNQRTIAAVWTASADVDAKYCTSAAGAFWISTNDYQVKKCPAGSSPMTAANYSAAYQVGTPSYKINSMGSLGPVPVIGKEDALYQWVEADSRFNPIYAVIPHKDNFTFLKPDGQGGLWSNLADGSAVRISQFGSITVYHPLREKRVGRDTPQIRIMGATQYGDTTYFTVRRSAFVQPSSGLAVMKTTDNFSSFTNYSTNSIDASRSTTADISSLDTLANGDALLIGFTDKFYAIEFAMKTLNSNAGALTGAYSTGAGTWSSVGAGFFDDTGVFTRSGRMYFNITSAVDSLWVTATYNSLTRYWVRITTSVAFDSTTTIGEVAILPRRAGPSFTTTSTAQGPIHEATGSLDKVIALKFVGDKPLWNDIQCGFSATGNRGILASALPAVGSMDASLLVSGAQSGRLTPLYPKNDPSVIPYPILIDDITASLPATFFPSSIDTGGLYELAYIEVYGKNLVEGTDSIQAAYRWDDTNPWFVTDVRKENYCRFNEFDEMNFGKKLHLAFCVIDSASTEPIGPSIDGIVVWLRPLTKPKALQPTRATPEDS